MNSGNLVAAVLGAVLKVIAAVAMIYLIYRGAAMCYDYGYRIFMEPAVSEGEGRTVTVTITEDMSAADIGDLFEQEGLVEDSTLFMLQYYLSEYRRDVKPGVFELNTAMTAEEMMAAMASSDAEDETGEAS
nr:endolytic transglycosylase MltG [uncultured Acetatifactor sp.]